MHIIKRIISEWDSGKQVVLLSVIHTEGSTYRKTGAQMLINDQGKCFGQLSGGCIEQDLIESSQLLLKGSNKWEIRKYKNISEPEFFGDSGCIGDIYILLQNIEWLKEYEDLLAKGIEADRDIKMAFVFEDHLNSLSVGQPFIYIDNECLTHYGDEFSWVSKEVRHTKRSGLFLEKDGQRKLYIQVVEKQKKMVIVGAGLDVVPLIKISSLLGYENSVCDFRSEWLFRFADESTNTVLVEREEKSIFQYFSTLPSHVPIIIMSHHLLFDALVLRVISQMDFDYIGLLGPRHRFERIVSLLENRPKKHVYTPIGLDIGADTPEEIAISILGEIIKCTNLK